MTGVCKYCGQVMAFADEKLTQEDANELATRNCSCEAAAKQRYITQSVISAKTKVEELCGENCDVYGFERVPEETVVAIKKIIDFIGSGAIGATACKVGHGSVKVAMNVQGDITIKRTETRGYSLSS